LAARSTKLRHRNAAGVLAIRIKDTYDPESGKTMTDLTNNHSPNYRFAALLADESEPRALHDTVLLQTSEWVAAPSLGALVPGWLVILPRRPALNFREWAKRGGDPSRLLDEAATALGLSPAEYLWFEHGPRAEHTLVGCGVDYAHLHMLIRPPFSGADLVAAAAADGCLSWAQLQRADVYAEADADSSYFAIGQDDEAWVATDVDGAGSQYLRRAVAGLLGQPTSWNYRTHSQAENVVRTIELVDVLRAQSAVV
jgi:hypothetical protein